MTDASTNDGAERPEDPVPTTIDTDDPAIVRYWCDTFGVTLEQLQESVRAVGTNPGDVRRQLLEQGSSAGAG